MIIQCAISDELGRVQQKRDALGTTTYYDYDENDNLISMSIENKGSRNREEIGPRLTQVYDYDIYDNVISKKITVDKEKQAAEKYIYDAEERITQIIQPNGVKKGFQYNDKGWVIAELENDQVKLSRVPLCLYS